MANLIDKNKPKLSVVWLINPNHVEVQNVSS
jgi:hypothetical protein